MALKPVLAAFALILLVANGVSAAKRSGGSSTKKPSEQVTARKEKPEPATATQPEEKAVKPLVAPSPAQFDMQKEQALEHQRTEIDWITQSVAEIKQKLFRLAVLGVAILGFSVAATILSAFALKQALSSSRDYLGGRRQKSRALSHGYVDDFGAQPDSRTRGQARTPISVDDTSQDRASRDFGDIPAPQTEAKPVKLTAAAVPYHSGVKPQQQPSRKVYTPINGALLMDLGAACLNFPCSIDEFRRQWEQHGGDREVEIFGSGQEAEPAVIFIDGGDGTVLGVPNTDSWRHLSEGGFFEPEGPVGPGATVRELLEIARVKRARNGKFVPDALGRVRVGL